MNDSNKLITQLVQELAKRRGIVVVRTQPIPGEGLELICRLANVLPDNWNLLSFQLLKSCSDRFVFRVHRTLILQERQGLDPKMVEAGSIQLWGGRVALLAAIGAVEGAPLPAPKEVTHATLANTAFWQPGPNGGGAYPASQAGFIPTPMATPVPGVRQ